MFRLIAQEDIDPIHRKVNVPISFRLTGRYIASSVLSQYKFNDPIHRKANVPAVFSLDDCNVASSVYRNVSLLLLHDNQLWDFGSPYSVKTERADAGLDSQTCIARLDSRARTRPGEIHFACLDDYEKDRQLCLFAFSRSHTWLDPNMLNVITYNNSDEYYHNPRTHS